MVFVGSWPSVLTVFFLPLGRQRFFWQLGYRQLTTDFWLGR